MMPDLVQQTIDEKDEDGVQFRCFNCYQMHRHTWKSGDFFCSGVVRHPRIVSFDVIRFCTHKVKEHHILVDDMSPDEALATSTILNDAVNQWLHKSKSYQKFRGDSGDLIFSNKS